MVLVGLGYGLGSPTISGLLSRATPDARQGAIFGALLSAQTLARLFNYLGANGLLERFGPSAPYWEGAAVGAFALALSAWLIRGNERRPIGRGLEDERPAEDLPDAPGTAGRPEAVRG